MNGLETIILIAQLSSSITSIIGIILFVYVTKIIRHLVEDDFRKIFTTLNLYYGIILLGVISMTGYHLLEDVSYHYLIEGLELGWIIFMFISIPFSIYGSYTILKFNELIPKIRIKKRK